MNISSGGWFESVAIPVLGRGQPYVLVGPPWRSRWPLVASVDQHGFAEVSVYTVGCVGEVSRWMWDRCIWSRRGHASSNQGASCRGERNLGLIPAVVVWYVGSVCCPKCVSMLGSV